MEHLQGDPAPMMRHAEQEVATILLVDRSAGRQLVRRHQRTQIAVLQVVPEHASSQHRVVETVPVIGRVQGFLQQPRNHLVVQLGAEPEHLGIGCAPSGEKDIGGVVESHPDSTGHASSSGATVFTRRQELLSWVFR